MLEVALQYVDRGWAVFPIRERGKTPITQRGHLDASLDPDQVAEWWDANPKANVGIVAGNGLAVLDVDPAAGGTESLMELLTQHGPLRTYSVRTGTGGVHLYLQDDPDSPLPQSAGRIAPGLDIRAGGKGYVVAPPSIHPNGAPYVVRTDFDLAPVPDWLRDLAYNSRGTNELLATGADGKVSAGTRNAALTALAGSLRRYGVGQEGILALLRAENRERCDPPLSDREVILIARSVARYRPDESVYVPDARDQFHSDPQAKDPDWLPASCTDSRVADWMAPKLRSKMVFIPRSEKDGHWMVYHGHVWEERVKESTAMVEGLMRDLGKKILTAAEGLGKKETERAVKEAQSLEQRGKIQAVMSLLEHRLLGSRDQFDVNLWHLNTPGGVVDLKNGTMTPCAPHKMHSRSTLVAPSPGPTPLWDKFLSYLTGRDKDLETFIKRYLGYCLTGDVSEKVLVFAWGSNTDTGKSTFVRTVQELFYTYSDSVDASAFISSGADRVPDDIARLPGVRMVTATEPSAGESWNEKAIKAITGGDEISARRLYGSWFVYKPQFKIVIVGNHEPEIRTVDDAMLRRILIVPMNHKVRREDQIENLSQRMIDEEGPQILNWMIEGCLEWQEHGLVPPEIVQSSTQAYADEEDILRQWMDECCEFGDDYEVSRLALYSSWSFWCKQRGEVAGVFNAFRGALRPKLEGQNAVEVFVDDSGARRRGYRGIRLVPLPTRLGGGSR